MLETETKTTVSVQKEDAEEFWRMMGQWTAVRQRRPRRTTVAGLDGTATRKAATIPALEGVVGAVVCAASGPVGPVGLLRPGPGPW